MALGFLGLLYDWIFFMIVIAGLIIFSKRIIGLIIKVGSLFKKARLKFDFRLIFYSVLFLVIIFNLFATMVPPWESDTIHYHTMLPKTYSIHHKIIDIPYYHFDNYPPFMRMLYLIGIMLSGGILAKLFAWFNGVLLVMAIYSFCKRFLSSDIGIISAVIFYTTPLIMQFITTGMVDISMTFFVFIAIYSFFIWFFSNRMRWIILSAVFAGVAGSIKINGSIPMLLLASGIFFKFIIYDKVSWKNFNKTFLYGLLFGVVMFSVMLPWLIKNYIWAGNPVFPFLYNIFGANYWSVEADMRLKGLFINQGIGDHSIFAFFKLPFYFTFLTGKFGELLGYGPIYLAFLPFIFFVKKKKLINSVLLYIFLSYIMWFFYTQLMRLTFFILPLLAIIAAFSVHKLLNSKLRKLILLVFVSYFLFTALIWVGVNGKQVKRGLSLESDEDFFSKIKTHPSYKEFKFINNNIGDINVILYYYKEDVYYSNYPSLLARPDQRYLVFDDIRNSEELKNYLKGFGVSHIFTTDYNEYYLPHSNNTIRIFNELFLDSDLVYQSNGTELYENVRLYKI